MASVSKTRKMENILSFKVGSAKDKEGILTSKKFE